MNKLVGVAAAKYRQKIPRKGYEYVRCTKISITSFPTLISIVLDLHAEIVLINELVC